MKSVARWVSRQQYTSLQVVVCIAFALFLWETQLGFGWVFLAAVAVGFLTSLVGVLIEDYGDRP